MTAFNIYEEIASLRKALGDITDRLEVVKSDVPGHAFHGNQYTAGGGANSERDPENEHDKMERLATDSAPKDAATHMDISDYHAEMAANHEMSADDARAMGDNAEAKLHDAAASAHDKASSAHDDLADRASGSHGEASAATGAAIASTKAFNASAKVLGD